MTLTATTIPPYVIKKKHHQRILENIARPILLLVRKTTPGQYYYGFRAKAIVITLEFNKDCGESALLLLNL